METISTKLADVNGSSRSDSFPVARPIVERSCIDRIGERGERARCQGRSRARRNDDSETRRPIPARETSLAKGFVAARWRTKTRDTTSENAHSPKERNG
jgi:hypothetical protein